MKRTDMKRAVSAVIAAAFLHTPAMAGAGNVTEAPPPPQTAVPINPENAFSCAANAVLRYMPRDGVEISNNEVNGGRVELLMTPSGLAGIATSNVRITIEPKDDITIISAASGVVGKVDKNFDIYALGLSNQSAQSIVAYALPSAPDTVSSPETTQAAKRNAESYAAAWQTCMRFHGRENLPVPVLTPKQPVTPQPPEPKPADPAPSSRPGMFVRDVGRLVI